MKPALFYELLADYEVSPQMEKRQGGSQ